MRIDRRAVKYIYCASVLLAVAIRIIQLQYVVDEVTGFYKSTSTLTKALPIIIIASIALIMLVTIIGSSRNIQGDTAIRQNPFLADIDEIASESGFITGISSICISVLLAFEVVNLYQGLTPMGNASMPYLADLVYIIFTLLTAFIFMRLGIIGMRKMPISRNMGYSLLIPVIWLTIRSTVLFMDLIVITSVSQNLLQLLSTLGMLLFMISASRLFSGFEKRTTRLKLIIIGLSSSLINFVSAVPLLLTNGRESTANTSILAVDILLAVFAASIVNMLLGQDRVIPIAVESVTEQIDIDENEF